MVKWYKDGEPVNEKVVGVRNSTVDSILFIRSAERDHSGKYELVVQIENMEDRATIDIRVVGTNAITELHLGHSALTTVHACIHTL